MSLGKLSGRKICDDDGASEKPQSELPRAGPIPISNRFTVIIFVSEYETVCARYICSSLLSARRGRGRDETMGGGGEYAR